MRLTVSLAFTLAFLPACGDLVSEANAPDSGTDERVNAAPAPAPASFPDAMAAPPSLDLPDASLQPFPFPPLFPFDGGSSPCTSAGGTCLELIPCDGVLVSLACGWSAACCMTTADAAATDATDATDD